MEFGYGYVNFQHLPRALCSLRLVENRRFQSLSLDIPIGLSLGVPTGLKTRVHTPITERVFIRIQHFLDIQRIVPSPTKIDFCALIYK
jgi:hypothetical protein